MTSDAFSSDGSNRSLHELNSTTDATVSLPHPVWLTVVFGALAAIAVVVTVVGNITVLMAFFLDKSIRQPTNYFLASLAVSDLVIGLFSMPIYTQYRLSGAWYFERWQCHLWLCLDWTVSTSTKYSVFFITLDRYLSVKIPVKYRLWRTEKKIILMVLATWILPSLFFFPFIVLWASLDHDWAVLDGDCEIEFPNSKLFTPILTIDYLVIIWTAGFMYFRIYCVVVDLQKQIDDKHKRFLSIMELTRKRTDPQLGSEVDCSVNIHNDEYIEAGAIMTRRNTIWAALQSLVKAESFNAVFFSFKKKKTDEGGSSNRTFAFNDKRHSSRKTNTSNPSQSSRADAAPKSQTEADHEESEECSDDQGSINNNRPVTMDVTNSLGGGGISTELRMSSRENNARKALGIITIIFGTSLLCWTPFYVCMVVVTHCKSCVNGSVYAFTWWLCYVKSAINPFCYAFVNPQFKATFRRIIQCDWRRT